MAPTTLDRGADRGTDRVTDRDTDRGARAPFAGLELEDRHVATEPPEARGVPRDGVRLLVSSASGHAHTAFRALPAALEPGDVLVVNTSGTRPAAIDATTADGDDLVLHVSTSLPGDLWMVEARRPVANGATEALALGAGPHRLALPEGSAVWLVHRAPGSQRLWLATFDPGPTGLDLLGLLDVHGRPIRYRYVGRDWPLDAYTSVFARTRTSAEMPSASRPFSADLVADLVSDGVVITPIELHTGVSSLEGHEAPYPEWFSVPATTARLVDEARAAGGRIIAVGTTVVRALESAVDDRGVVHPAHGWTDVVVTPERGVRAVDGLVTGWHEPTASHIDMLLAVAPEPLVREAYATAFDAGYRWHEFGDSHLLLPGPPR